MQRLGFMLQPTLAVLQHVPDDKRNFVATLHNVFFPVEKRQDLRYYCRDVSPLHVMAACRNFIELK